MKMADGRLLPIIRITPRNLLKLNRFRCHVFHSLTCLFIGFSLRDSPSIPTWVWRLEEEDRLLIDRLLLYASERLTPKNNFAEVWEDGNFKTNKDMPLKFCPQLSYLMIILPKKCQGHILIGFEVTILSNLRKVILRGQPFGRVL